MTTADHCQRWTGRRASWRPTHEGGFDAARYRVVAIDRNTAKAFVRDHHYSGTCSSDVHRFGLVDLAPRADVVGATPLDEHRGWLVGVIVYASPQSEGVLTVPLPTLRPYRESIDLSRMVLLDEVPCNAETWFATETFRRIRDKGIRGVVMMSDPIERRTPQGLIMPGHVGCVYQSLGGECCGLATRRSLVMLPDQTALPASSRSKVTGDRRRGYRRVVERLELLAGRLDVDIPAWSEDADGSVWMSDTLRRLGATTITHPGNIRYVFRLDSLVPLGLPTIRYPKLDDLDDWMVEAKAMRRALEKAAR